MFKKIVKKAVEEINADMKFNELKGLAKPIGGTSEERVFQLEKRFEALCQHLGVHVGRNYQEFVVHNNRPPMTGGASLTAENSLR